MKYKLTNKIFVLYKTLYYYERNYPLLLSLIIWGVITNIVWTCSLPLIFDWVFDKVLPTKNIKLLIGSIIPFIVFFLFVSASNLTQIYASSKMGSKILAHLRFKLFHKIQNNLLNLSEKEDELLLIKNFIRDTGVLLQNSVFNQWASINSICSAFVSIVLLFYLNWLMSLIVLIFILLALWSSYFYASLFLNIKKTKDFLEIKQFKLFEQAYTRKQLISFYSLKSFFRRQFKTSLTQYRASLLKFFQYFGISGNISLLIFHFMQLFVICFGSYLVLKDYLTTGQLVAYVVLMKNARSNLNKFFQLYPNLNHDEVTVSSIHQLVKIEHQHPIPSTIPAPLFSCKLIFENINLDKMMFQNLNFEIQKLKSYCFVGLNEEQKNAFIKLILKQINPSFGHIFLDNISYQSISSPSIREQFFILGPKPLIFEASIIDNIRLGKPDIEDNDIIQITKFLGIHDIIMQLPNQYHTVISHHQPVLTGSQLQLICIARALAAKPSILILDNTFANLDPFTSDLIENKFQSLKEKTTLIYIGNHLSSIIKMDTIFVLENGKIIESGQHHELLNHEGTYYYLWYKQKGFSLDSKTKEIHIIPSWLKNIALFNIFNTSELEQLSQEFLIQSNLENEIIIKQDFPAEKFYIIVAGSVEVFRSEKDKATQQLAQLTDGDYFGEIALLFDTVRNASVKTKTNTIFLTLHYQQFRRFFRKLPKPTRDKFIKNAILHLTPEQKSLKIRVDDL